MEIRISMISQIWWGGRFGSQLNIHLFQTINKWQTLMVQPSHYGCAWEVTEHKKKRKPRATFAL